MVLALQLRRAQQIHRDELALLKPVVVPAVPSFQFAQPEPESESEILQRQSSGISQSATANRYMGQDPQQNLVSRSYTSNMAPNFKNNYQYTTIEERTEYDVSSSYFKSMLYLAMPKAFRSSDASYAVINKRSTLTSRLP